MGYRHHFYMALDRFIPDDEFVASFGSELAFVPMNPHGVTIVSVAPHAYWGLAGTGRVERGGDSRHLLREIHRCLNKSFGTAFNECYGVFMAEETGNVTQVLIDVTGFKFFADGVEVQGEDSGGEWEIV